MSIPIEEYFTYHPPTTQKRIDKHNKTNDIYFKIAKYLNKIIENEDCLKMSLMMLQQSRMFANQGITIDELKGK